MDEPTVKLRAILTWEYEADPSHYGTNDPVEMARMDSDEDAAESAEQAIEHSALTFRVEAVGD